VALADIFNQIFLMMFMSAGCAARTCSQGRSGSRRASGAPAARPRAPQRGRLPHNVNRPAGVRVKGIGSLPWSCSGGVSRGHTTGLFTDENIYALILIGAHLDLRNQGGMISVVITEVTQFVVLTLTALTIGVIAIVQGLARDDASNIPPGGINPSSASIST